MKCKLAVSVILVCMMATIAALPGRAQSPTTGQISGVVKDPSGAAVTGAAVSAKSSNGTNRTESSGAEGRYIFALLPPGEYVVHVEAQGFAAYDSKKIEVRITEFSEADVNLSIAGAAQSVTVSGTTTEIQTSSVTSGRVIDETVVRQLPLPTRNYTQLLGLSPGAGENLARTTDLGRGDLDFNVNGQRDTSNNVTLDGTIITSPGTNSTPSLAVPAPDTIQQFIVQTSLYDATQGRNTGGGLAVVTKSGTDAYHGNVYEFFRNSDLNANDFFLNEAGDPRPQLSRNQFGGTFGGPVWKDKTFFFLSYEGTRERNGASQNSLTTLNIPEGLTNDRSTATLNALEQSYNPGVPISSIALGLLQATLPNGQFAIPSAAPNGVLNHDLDNTVQTPISTPSRFSEDQFNVNVDHNITATNKLSGKFFYSEDPQFQALFSFVGADPFQAPGYGGNITFSNRILSLTDTQIIGNRIVNEVHFGFSRINAPSTPQEPFTNAQFGIINPIAAQFPGLATIQLLGEFSIGSTPLGDQRSTTENFQGSDTISYTNGKHFLRVGGDFIRNHIDFFFHSFSRGEILFNNFPSFLAGNINVGLLGNGIPNRNFRINDIDLFVQEDYRMLSNLTINLGIRLESNGGISDTQGRIVNFDPAAFAAVAATCNVVTPCVPPDGFNFFKAGQPLNPNRLNWAPRIGLAWKPFHGNNFVVRTGYGIYYDRFSSRFANFQIFNYPYDVIGASLGGILPGSFANPFPNLAGLSFPLTPTVPAAIPLYASGFPLPGFSTPISGLYADPNLSTPYTQQYNFGFQWEFAKSWLWELGYVGSKGTKLINVYNFSQGATGTAPYSPFFFSTNKALNGFDQVQTDTNSLYNSLQTSVSKHFSYGLQLLASYTFSKSTDEGSGSFENELGGYPGDQQNPATQRGLSDFNRKHRFVLSAVYDLPNIYKGESGALRRAANNWELATIITEQSGLPFSVVCEIPSTLLNRADVIAGSTFTEPGSTKSKLNEYFNTAAFAPGCANVAPYGTSPRNFLIGPGQHNVDFSIVKFIPVTERFKAEFRTEFFNAFNEVNFSQPNANVAAPAFGQITSTSGGPRIIQFALKLSF